MKGPLPMQWPQGFCCGTTSCGLKSSHEPDLAVVVSHRACQAAGLFTRNLVTAAPVRYSQQLLSSGQPIQGVVINSKNANAVTGPTGDQDARTLTQRAQELLALPGQLLAMSTGVIGQPMPMDRYLPGLEQACGQLHSSPAQLAQAMMTTDTYPKVVERQLGSTRWLALAKGAGMIHPDMATLLALVVSDAQLDPNLMHKALRAANEASFQCLTVDGDTSTNDSLLFLANGQAGPAPSDWPQHLSEMLQELAQLVAFDGEGASHQVTLTVTGLADNQQARQMGRTILTSPLVKTAIAGKDANWGRILAAAGRAGIEFDPAQASLRWNELLLLSQGRPTNPDSLAEQQATQGSQVQLLLELGAGPGQATLWSCDLTHDYVSINGDYRS